MKLNEPKTDEVKRSCTEMHNEKLDSFTLSQNINKTTISHTA